jgi:hypothetical protein
MDKTEQLIGSLSREAPMRGATRYGIMLTAWIVGMALYLALLVLMVFKPRPDLMEKLAQPLFTAEIGTLGLLALASARSAVSLSFPDIAQKNNITALPALAASLFILVLLLEYRADLPPAPMPGHGMECCMAITFAALPLAALMFMRIRRMAPLLGLWAGCTALLAAFSLSALALRLSEPTDSIRHLVEMHYLPMIAVAIIGLMLGKKLLKF